MVVVEASKLKLPTPSLSSFPPLTTSLLFEPHSLSLALMHSDSSFSLYPSTSPLALSSLPPPQTLIPSPSSSSTFLLLQNPDPNPNPNLRALFVVSGPYRGGSSVLLRFYVLLRKTNSFARARLVCNQRGLRFDDKLGVLVDVNHGVSVRLSGSVNFFAMYTVSSSKIFVFAVRTVGDDGDQDGGEDGVVLKLMRCAVIECSKPVFSISVSSGFLILGEESGVRVFNLRPLVKGRVRKVNNLNLNSNLGMHVANGKLESRGFHLPNGLIGGDYAKHGGGKNGGEGASGITRNGYLDGRVDNHYGSVKQSSIKLRQDSSEGGACFVAFRSGEVGSSTSTRKLKMSVKAISIQALSPKKFVILDSVGELHLLHLSNSVIGSDSSCHMKQLPHIMEVQKLVVFPDVSIRNQTVWISDGCYSVHMMAVSDMDAAVNENDINESGEKLMQISVRQFSLVKRLKILLLWLQTLF
ncbi:uncharacterized protein LOC133859228 isoform X2 [Alnus glutinosa]|uniref:uncharacterized protein LOC133859228 isoform X2 n=1 Tax=Alnus glutinosa TaxID=3517 RepID=UPI002D78FD27|nr:uncharacterized protein LOC133859228 isoform X2 [Alnus glutinosa]